MGLVGQQVFFSQLDLAPGPGRGFNPDAWDGYAANRDRIVAGLVSSPVRNAVVLSGDVHSHWAAEVRENFDDPSSTLVATEFVTTSITSGGDGSDTRDEIERCCPTTRTSGTSATAAATSAPVSNPASCARTSVCCRIVSRPDAPVHTGASFVLTDRASVLDVV